MVEYAAYLDGVVHEPTQTGERGFDLTVAEIYDIDEPGRVDFGGGELAPAGTTPHDSRRRDPDDDYAWWHLSGGTYLLEYNEAIVDEGATVTVQPRVEILERGATHPTLTVSALPRMPVTVGGAGIRLKENARVSTLTDLEPG